MGCAGLPGTSVVIVVLAELLLLPGVGSVVPAGVVTPATLEIVPLAPAAPLSVKVTLPPEGSVGITIPAPCSNATVVFPAAGHTAPPLADPQATAVAVKFATAGSVTIAPPAGAGPAFETTSVKLTVALGRNVRRSALHDREIGARRGDRRDRRVCRAAVVAGVGSVIPAGVATLATFEIEPVAPAVPVRVNVTLPPGGSVGITIPAPCSNAIVVLLTVGHTAPPLGEPQVTLVAVKFATDGSVTTAPSAEAAPALVTTSV
jgi:hypothetical protein